MRIEGLFGRGCHDIPMFDDLSIAEAEYIGYGIGGSFRRRGETGVQEDQIAFGDGPDDLPGRLRDFFDKAFQEGDRGFSGPSGYVGLVLDEVFTRIAFKGFPRPKVNETLLVERKYDLAILFFRLR